MLEMKKAHEADMLRASGVTRSIHGVDVPAWAAKVGTAPPSARGRHLEPLRTKRACACASSCLLPRDVPEIHQRCRCKMYQRRSWRASSRPPCGNS